MPEFPTGTVTFLFTDVEGSTRLLQEHGDRYADLLAEHRRVLRDAFARRGGVEVDTQGDAFFVAFARASDALAAAADAQAGLRDGTVRVRIGLHTGEPLLTDEGYVGIDVHRAARIAAAGHGGQVLLSQATRDLASDEGFRDLGQHRLKDLSAPERIWQLGEGDFPPLKTLHQTNLPVQPNRLVGRGREVADVAAFLRDGTRLLTLTGPGGSGKTRLALHAAAELADNFPDGVWFVPLAPVADALLVEPTIAQVVGTRGDLHDALRSRRLLLVLDNLEHVIEAAPAIADLLSAAPQVRVMATSRERLAIAAEQEYEVPTLPTSEAVALFVDRARQLRPAFEVDEHVNLIARRLDGLPLALELAAARVKVLTTAQIAERLNHSLDLLTRSSRDVPERQRTLRATIEWSYQLLDERERALFAELSIFAASFDLEAAELVCGADVDTLQSLVDKSLLRQTGEGRFFMLETIREYASPLCPKETDSARRARFIQWMVNLAEEERERRLRVAGQQGESYARVEREHPNIRAALEIAQTDDSTSFARGVVAISRFWYVRGLLREGRAFVESALEQSELQPLSVRASIATVALTIAMAQGDAEAAEKYADEAVELCRATGDLARLSSVIRDRAVVARARADYERAEADLAEAEALARRSGNDEAIQKAMTARADFALNRGQLEVAERATSDALELARRLRDDEGIAYALLNTAHVRLLQHDAVAAESLYREALEVASRNGVFGPANLAVEGLAASAAARGDVTRARVLTDAARAAREDRGLGLELSPVENDIRTRMLESIRPPDGAPLEWEEAVTLALSVD